MKYSKYFGAKRHGFIKSESNLVPKGASHFKNENIRCYKCNVVNTAPGSVFTTFHFLRNLGVSPLR